MADIFFQSLSVLPIQAVRKVDVINETLKSTHNSKQKTCSNHRSNP